MAHTISVPATPKTRPVEKEARSFVSQPTPTLAESKAVTGIVTAWCELARDVWGSTVKPTLLVDPPPPEHAAVPPTAPTPPSVSEQGLVALMRRVQADLDREKVWGGRLFIFTLKS